MNPNRIQLVDIARGLALIAMTLFHLVFDLEMFGLVERGTTFSSPWLPLARAIASSFLFLAGFSLFLAVNANGSIRATLSNRAWLKRTALIALSALAITIATFFAMPQSFIFFGILHHIVLASFLALLFVRLPFWLTVVLALCAYFLPNYINLDFLNGLHGWWTGLASNRPSSSDFVPVFPWFSAVLAGLSAAQFCSKFGYFSHLARHEYTSKPLALLTWMGRNSLAYYLLHQPVLISLIWITIKLMNL